MKDPKERLRGMSSEQTKRYYIYRQFLYDIVDGKRTGTIKELDKLLNPYGRNNGR